MFRLSRVMEEASKLLADPLIQLDITMNSTVLVFHKRVSSKDEFEKTILSALQKITGAQCLSVVVSFPKRRGEGRLLVCGDAVVASVYREGGVTGRVVAGEAAFRRIIEEIASSGAIVDVMSVPRDKLHPQLRKLAERAGEAAIPAGRPPVVWLGSTLYGLKIERIVGEGGISYVLEGVSPSGERFAVKILRERSRLGAALAVGNRAAIESFARTGTSMMKMTFASRGVLEASLEDRGVANAREKVKVIAGFSQNIIRVYGVYIPREEYNTLDEYVKAPPALIMELVDGVTLDRLENRIRPYEARHIVFQVAGALALAHVMGFGHFDVKLQNVMVVQTGGGMLRAKLFDFTALPIDRRRPPMLEEITPEYADPYSLLHGARAYPSYDVYSLGLMAYRLFYRKRPYARLALNYVVLKRVVPRLAQSMERSLPPEARDYAKKFERLAATYTNPDEFLLAAQEMLDMVEPITPPPGQPENIVDILRKMLSLDPRRRYRDAFELLRDLGPLFGVTL